MPETQVHFYCEEGGTAPVLEWLVELLKKNRKAAEKCFFRIETLRQMGYTRTERKKDMATTTDAMQILKQKIGDVPDFDERVAVDKLNVRVAMLIYRVRTESGITQAELARRVGTSQPNIARLEDADYEGHSLSMLQRIAVALDKQIEIQMVDVEVA